MVHAAALSEWALVSPFLVLATSCDISTGELHSVRGQGYNLTPAHTVYIRCTYGVHTHIWWLSLTYCKVNSDLANQFLNRVD